MAPIDYRHGYVPEGLAEIHKNPSKCQLLYMRFTMSEPENEDQTDTKVKKKLFRCQQRKSLLA